MDRYEKEIKHSKWKFYFFFFLFFENGKFRNFNGQKYTLLEEKQNVHTWAQIAALSKRRRWSMGWENSDCTSGGSSSFTSAKLRNMEQERVSFRERERERERQRERKMRRIEMIDWLMILLTRCGKGNEGWGQERERCSGAGRSGDEWETQLRLSIENLAFAFCYIKLVNW